MATSPTSQSTDFTKDVLGRYMCNGLDEALHSADKNAQRPDGSPQSDARPFNAIIIGGGSFGGVLAQHLLYADETNSYRILVLEAGRHSLPEHFQNPPSSGSPARGVGVSPGGHHPANGRDFRGSPTRRRALAVLRRLVAAAPRRRDAARKWPPDVVSELKQKYFDRPPSRSVPKRNDFIHGELHSALRKIFADGIGNKVRHAIPLNQLPLHLSEAGAELRLRTSSSRRHWRCRQAAASRVLPDQQVQLGPAADGGGARGADALRPATT